MSKIILSRFFPHFSFFLLLLLTSCKETEPIDLRITTLTKEELAIQAEVARNSVTPVLVEGLKMEVWGVDSLVRDPIALQVAEDGSIYYTRSPRRNNAEFDIRGHQDWEIRSIALQNIEDKRNFLRTELSPERSPKNQWLKDLNGDGSNDWRDMLVERNEVYQLKDTDGDGLADWKQLQVYDFHEEVTDVAGGVLKTEDALFVGAGPDMWRLLDTNGDGIMDEKKSMSYGYGIHVGFGGHGMSGVEMGPDGRIYWGIGDIGFNGKGDDGTEYKYPNRGVIARSNPDGTDFEIFAMGVRNTHEFVFDKYTNLISVDNDGDHAGEKERLVYLTRGSDTGWRINWQFGKYRDPNNNTYKVWMDEKLFLPRWKGQANYITPPLLNYVSGPTGMVYNPGAGLGERWVDHFLIVEFVGNAAGSGIHAFQLTPKGASFELSKTEKIVKNFLPTGIDFAPDGSLYMADWVNGWDDKNYGRIWKLTDQTAEGWEIQKQTAAEIKSDYKKLSEADLKSKLYFEDLRIRRKAQFELVKRGEKGAAQFKEVIQDQTNQIARIHGILGLSQLARLVNKDYALPLVVLLQDKDPEIRAQAAKWLGDIRFKGASKELIGNLSHENARVRFFSAEALGRAKEVTAIQPLIQLLESNNDEDAYLRHSASYALSQIGQEEPLSALASHPSKAVRMGAILALRRLESPELAKFLEDQDEEIVTEAALAIHDDFSVPAALPKLATLLPTTSFTNEPLLRRLISANHRLGKAENLTALLTFLDNSTNSLEIRKEAIAAVGTWENPSVLDRVDGRYRGEVTRDLGPAQQQVASALVKEANHADKEIRSEALKAIGKLGIQDLAPQVFTKLKTDSSQEVKVEALQALVAMDASNLSEAISFAMRDVSEQVRVAGLGLISQTSLPNDQKVPLLMEILTKRTLAEKQKALLTLGSLPGSKESPVWNSILADFDSGKLPAGTWVELEEAIIATGDSILKSTYDKLLTEKSGAEPWKAYAGALAEGDVRKGRSIFFQNQTAQCIRCHAYSDMGGNAGPALDAIGKTLSREDLLIALVEPSQRLAPGYGTINLTLGSGEKVTGLLLEDSSTNFRIQVGTTLREIAKSEVTNSSIAPSSMPPMGTLLSKRELRDLVSYLVTLNRSE